MMHNNTCVCCSLPCLMDGNEVTIMRPIKKWCVETCSDINTLTFCCESCLFDVAENHLCKEFYYEKNPDIIDNFKNCSECGSKLCEYGITLKRDYLPETQKTTIDYLMEIPFCSKKCHEDFAVRKLQCDFENYDI